ncbi:DUF1441 family protein [Marinicellulosiphila megalodicopiae]|uniref:DUF1441 family protein n=1 Tax=Marinicellulosiphila megalodicopiae TaxID=2724896 RepID=UPI003BAEF351
MASTINGKRLFSITQLSADFGLDRRTVSKRIEGIRPCGNSGGHPAYTLPAVATALMKSEAKSGALSMDEVDKLEPSMRVAHWDAELKKQKYLQESGMLITEGEFILVVGLMQKSISDNALRLPNKLQQSLDLTIEQTRTIAKEVRGWLDELADDQLKTLSEEIQNRQQEFPEETEEK